MSFNLKIHKKIILIFVCMAILLSSVLFGVKKLKSDKKMNFYKIENLDDLHKLFPKNLKDIEEYSKICCKIIIDETKKIIEIEPDKRNFENSVKAIDNIVMYCQPIIAAIGSLEFVNPDKELRQAAHEQMIKLSNFLIDHLSCDVQLYNALKQYVDLNLKNENLSKEELYFVNETIKGFKKEGLDLAKEQLEKVKNLSKELNELELKFEMNIAQHICKIKFTKNELVGLTQELMNSFIKDEDDNYILGCDYPTYFAIIDHCKIESTRKKMYLEFSNRGYPKNIEILNEVIKKRDQKAKLLGFNSFADLSLDDQMAKNPILVENFLDGLMEKAQKKASEEIEIFTKDLPESVTLENGKIKPWDIRYIKEIYRQKNLNLDDSKIAEYFPEENTINKLLEIYEKFLSLKFEKVDSSGFWHKDISLIKAYKDGKFLGFIFLDLFPRADKFNHAGNLTIVNSHVNKQGNFYPSVSIIAANFPKPTQDKPALLKYNDVITFFHEFGHAIHALLGTTEFISYAGTNVKKDFVEMPSQMLENWIKDKDILKDIAQHYKTKETLPDSMIEKMIDLDKFDSGDFALRQIYLSFLSLEYFKNGEMKDTQAIAKKISTKVINHLI